MSEMKACRDALLTAVHNSEEYQDFVKYRDLLRENPELMDRVNTFRGSNFRLQNEANRDELFRAMEQLNRESRELRRDPLVNAFLDNPDAFTYGFEFSRILIISGPVLGLLFVFVNAIQATGAAIPSLILSVSRQGLVYLPILFVFRTVFDSPHMLVLTQPVTDYLALIMAIVLFIVTIRKYFTVKQS